LSLVGRHAIFISGRGSNAQNLFDHLGLDFSLVYTNKKNAYGVQRSRRSGIPVWFSEDGYIWKFDSSEKHIKIGPLTDFVFLLQRAKIKNIYLMGYMRIISPEICKIWKGKIFNIHPSLLPSFKGLNAIESSFAQKQPMGVTVHHVTEGVDEGQIIKQETVFHKPPSHLTECWLPMAIAEQRVVSWAANRYLIQNGVRN
jgi:phosphoribosylglycinamide formyltransferase-1